MSRVSKIALLSVIFVWLFSCAEKTTYEYPFQNPSLSVEERVNDLVSRLTIDEKILQMIHDAPAIERFGIPAYNWWNEALHGVARSPYYVTSFPQAIGMAATWDVESMQLMASYTADEGRAIFHDSQRKGVTGPFLGLTYWTPNINIFRDPRWGRGQETYGEDPYLTGEIGKAFVLGLEGDHPKYLKASACAKHFAVHSGPEWNRHTYNAVVSNYDLRDTYLPAFRKLIVDAKVSGVMCAYNALDGDPCCASNSLMQEILRKEWNFTGYVTSDCGGIRNFFHTHKTHPNPESAAAAAVIHGTDCECGRNPVYKALHKALEDGLITEEQIDVSVKRLFTIRFRLGMFDPDEMVPFAKTDVSVLEREEHQAHALKMARQSMVLLKNQNNTLPLSKNIKKIAVVGPNADDESVLLANYYGYPTNVTSVLEGIKGKLGAGTEVVFEKGTSLTDNVVFKSEYDVNLLSFDGQKGLRAEYFDNTQFKGEPKKVQMEEKINYKWGDGYDLGDDIITRNFSIRYTTVFKPEKSGDVAFNLKGDDGCRMFLDGNKVIDSNDPVDHYSFVAQKGKSYEVVIEYWQYADNAEIKFDMGVVKRESPQVVASRIKDADAIVFVGGLSAHLEGEEMKVAIDGFKGGDRTNIALPVVQTQMMKALVATGKPVIFVNMSGSAIGFEWEAANVPAILQAWYGGQAGGTAVADVLFGDYNPAGRLPVTFYKNVNDLPDFEDYSMENRTYRYFKGEPLYPFGFGLSYTSFSYNLETISNDSESNVSVSINVTNSGKMDGEEVVQLYVAHKDTPYRTPIHALKRFQRIHLKAGETKQVVFQLTEEDLALIDQDGIQQAPKGEIEISVGGNQPLPELLKDRSVVKSTITFNKVQ
jgi:beta-glucosidase